ncbi:MAG: flagellar biosynthesis protein FlhB, partial [Pseudomonadales bacterium]|nr:flagellar biosynthesis protein FlhB [Pseudomonadales bacterium]
MAEEESSQEKTEEPTSKKLEKAREEGQTPRSKELNTLAVLLGGSIGLFVFGNVFYEAGRDLFAFNFSIERVDGFDETRMLAHIAKSARIGMFVLLPFFAVMLIASLIGPLSLGGWLLSTKVIAPKFSRLDPLAGIKRMFSVNSLVELGKSVAKVLVVSAVAIATLYFSVPGLRMLGMQDLQVAIDSATVIIMTAFFLMSLSILLIAAIDVPFQIVQHVNKLKMSMQEVKDEMKNTEGKPEVKSRIRQVQQEMSRGRMMSAVPDADVIITNPTHFAVALKYDPANMATPVVVARGVDNMA